MVNCAVYMCKRRSSSSNLRKHNVSYHVFPKDPILKQEWTKFCNRDDKWTPTRTSVICSDHFTPSSFQVLSNIRRILIEGAKPTIRSRNSTDSVSLIKSKSKKKDKSSGSKSSKPAENIPTNDTESLIKRINDQLITKSKKIKRLQAKNRYLRNKMDGLKNSNTFSNEVTGKKYSEVLSSSVFARDDELKQCTNKRSRKMSEEKKQEETLIATEVGLAECRTCLQALDANSVLVDLFQCWVPPWDGMESTIAEDLAKLANVKITQTDRYSKVICEPCCLKLQSACDFACSVRKHDRALRQRYPSLSDEMDNGNRTIWPKPIQLDKNVNGTVYENAMDVEIKQEVLSEDEYANNIVMDDLAALEIKIEPEELIQPMQVPVPNEHEEQSQAECEDSYAIFNGHTTPEEKYDITQLTNGVDNKEDIPRIKEEPICEEDDDDIISYDLSLECMLCGKEFNCVSGLKAHVIAQHSYKSVRRKVASNSPEKSKRNHEFICGTCQRKFTTSTDLMVHETCHNKSVCYACSAKFDTFDQLTRHSRCCKAIANKEITKPKTLEDVKRPVFQEPLPVNMPERRESMEKFKCPLCNEEFSDSYYLAIHDAVHHSINNEQIKFKEEESDIVPQVVSDNLKIIFGSD